VIATRDVIVVGSGASATNAVFRLVKDGFSVLMLDVGNVDDRYASLIPDAPFSEIRRTQDAQHVYFLGGDFEGVPFGNIRVGGQLTPPRRYIQRDTDRLTPLKTHGFTGFESLALGGLAAGWGGVAVQYDDVDLAGFPIKHRDLAPHYEAVSARIGISGARDDLLRFYGDCSSLQPPLELDSNAEAILSRYQRIRWRLHRKGLYVGRARLAVLSRDLGARRSQQYHDMDYYSDGERSVFRPAFLLEEMRRSPGFTYARPYLVERFRERREADGVEVEALNVGTGERDVFAARRLILSAGTMGTARIVLRSLERYDTPIPIVTNPGTYVPCIHFAMLGKAAKDRRHSLTQLGAMLERDREQPTRVYAEVHSYRSLLLFKVAKESFLPMREGLRTARELLNAFVILVIHHQDHPSPGKHCILRHGAKGEPDVLEVHFEPPDVGTARRQASDEKVILRGFRKLGCWPLSRIRPGSGASLHYAGPLPMTTEERGLTVTPACLLRGTRSVYIADGSVLPYLPAKASTLTLMANADRVGAHVLGDLA
jgi:choline dehydrogenase-like flavoprotein